MILCHLPFIRRLSKMVNIESLLITCKKGLEYRKNNDVMTRIYGKTSWDVAARLGNLNWMKYLSREDLEGCTMKTMRIAAAFGNLEIVKWLHENRGEGCMIDSMTIAAINGHLEVVKWLHENRMEGCTKNAITLAAENGHMEIIRFLHENRIEGCKDKTIYNTVNYIVGILRFLNI